MAPLLVGTLLALAALAYVLYPLFAGPPVPARSRAPRKEPTAREEAVAALREVEFDRETGKLSDSDYSTLKGRYTAEAVAAMRAEAPEIRLPLPAGTVPGSAAMQDAGVSDDDVEARIRRARSEVPTCRTCGPSPEPDAVYCSTCGTYLRERCASCSQPATEPGARFCASCGHNLAA